jgi:hypothetical protein
MRRSRTTGLVIAFLLLAGLHPAADAQEPGRVSSVPPRERVHPEMVDTSWGPGTAAAWKLAQARQWDDARSHFLALHQAHPDGLEAILGLAFVARATGARAEARRWLRAAMALEPSKDIRDALEATEWDRPGNVDVVGEAARVNNETIADWSLAAVVPVVERFAFTGRVGELGAGDPLRGIFLDSAATGRISARVMSIGGIARPLDNLVMTARVEYWSTPGDNETYVWFDATERFGQYLGVRVGMRPLGGRFGAPQVNVATDLRLSQHQSMALEVIQGTHATPFEPRTMVRAFYFATPTVSEIVRAGIVRDVDPINSATTAFVSGTQFLNPTFGIHVDLSARRGVFERSAAGAGVVFRW